jgi:hypothetical protein
MVVLEEDDLMGSYFLSIALIDGGDIPFVEENANMPAKQVVVLELT